MGFGIWEVSFRLASWGGGCGCVMLGFVVGVCVLLKGGSALHARTLESLIRIGG